MFQKIVKKGFFNCFNIFTFKSGKTDSHKRVEVGILIVHEASLNLADMVKWFGIWRATYPLNLKIYFA